jgi:hypothetical protein
MLLPDLLKEPPSPVNFGEHASDAFEVDLIVDPFHPRPPE